MAKNICSIEGCSQFVNGRGLCQTHYVRAKRAGALPPKTRIRSTAQCSVENCQDVVSGFGYCKRHYDRSRLYGDPLREPLRGPKVCTVEECGRSVDARGWCTIHYARWRNHGDHLWTKPIPPEKACTQCGIVKPLSGYSFDNRRDDGRQSNCRKCTHLRQAHYRMERRAKEWGADAERIDALVLAERDAWICGICHKAIDPTLTYPNRGYRSIDHVTPLSMGGDHTYKNTRIAHWYCNVKRGAARGETWLNSSSENSQQLGLTG